MLATRRASLRKDDQHWQDFCKTPANSLRWWCKEEQADADDDGQQQEPAASTDSFTLENLLNDDSQTVKAFLYEHNNNEEDDDLLSDLNLSLLDLPEDDSYYYLEKLQRKTPGRTLAASFCHSSTSTATSAAMSMSLYHEESYYANNNYLLEDEGERSAMQPVKRWKYDRSSADDLARTVVCTSAPASPSKIESSYNTTTNKVEQQKPASWVVCDDASSNNTSTAPPPPARMEKKKDGSSIERASLRLDGLEGYTLIGAMVSTTSFTEILGSDFWNTNGALPPFLKYSTLIVSALVTLLGIYSTIVFASTSLYGKTAVGMDRDQIFVYFMERTKTQRIRAFNALAACILLFAVEVCLVVADQLPSRNEVLPFLLLSGSIIYFGVQEVRGILRHAAPIFTNQIPEDERDLEEKEKRTRGKIRETREM